MRSGSDKVKVFAILTEMSMIVEEWVSRGIFLPVRHSKYSHHSRLRFWLLLDRFLIPEYPGRCISIIPGIRVLK